VSIAAQKPSYGYAISLFSAIKPPERLLHEVVAFLDVVEDLPPEDEVAAH